jgi:hypothetical protein
VGLGGQLVGGFGWANGFGFFLTPLDRTHRLVFFFFFLRKKSNVSIENGNQYKGWKLALVEQTPSRLQKAYLNELFWRASGP